MKEISASDLLAQMRAMSAQSGARPTSAGQAVGGPAAIGGGTASQDAGGVEFGKMVRESIDAVNDRQGHARKLAEAFELGDPNVDLTRVMVEMQKARVSFEAVYQVRNKLVEAYKEVMSMPV